MHGGVPIHGVIFLRSVKSTGTSKAERVASRGGCVGVLIVASAPTPPKKTLADIPKSESLQPRSLLLVGGPPGAAQPPPSARPATKNNKTSRSWHRRCVRASRGSFGPGPAEGQPNPPRSARKIRLNNCPAHFSPRDQFSAGINEDEVLAPRTHRVTQNQ